jgi:hypothetical protein
MRQYEERRALRDLVRRPGVIVLNHLRRRRAIVPLERFTIWLRQINRSRFLNCRVFSEPSGDST